MTRTAPDPSAPWRVLSPSAVTELLSQVTVRWWISGGVALDLWLGAPVRERRHCDVSLAGSDLAQFVAALPEEYEVWAQIDDELVPFSQVTEDDAVQPVLIRHSETGDWVLKVNVEDGAPRAWVYKRDPRLQLAWDRAVLDINGIPVGAPEVQLVWKALRPTPEDDLDKNAIVTKLSDEARQWYERCILSIHPHSTWAIHVRSPFAPAKASWNRSKNRD